MEAEDRQPVLGLLLGDRRRRVLEAELAQRRRQPLVDLVGGAVERRRGDGGQHEGEDDGARQVARQVAEIDAEEGDHQAEFGDLGDAHRSDLGVALVEAVEIEHREQDQLARRDRRDGDADGEQQHARSARRRDAEPEADEEQRHEEILHHADLGDDLGGVGQAGNGGAGNQRAHARADVEVHLHAERHLGDRVEAGAEEDDGEAPADRADQDDLRHLGDPAEGDRDQRAGAGEGEGGEQADAEEGGEDRQDVGLVQAGLQDDHDDRPQVLEDQQAEGDAAGHRVELEGFLEQLDDQQRRRAGDHHADVERAEIVADDRAEADQRQQLRHQKAEGDDQRIGQQPAQHDRAAALEDLADVHLQADDEQQQDETELGDGVDVFAVGDESESQRSGDHAGDDVAGDRRQLEAREDDRQGAGQEQPDADVVDQRRHLAFGRMGRAGGKHGQNERRCPRPCSRS